MIFQIKTCHEMSIQKQYPTIYAKYNIREIEYRPNNYIGTVAIKDLETLTELARELNEEIIIQVDEQHTIEIYDDYRE